MGVPNTKYRNKPYSKQNSRAKIGYQVKYIGKKLDTDKHTAINIIQLINVMRIYISHAGMQHMHIMLDNI